jgi:hypothetical protein
VLEVLVRKIKQENRQREFIFERKNKIFSDNKQLNLGKPKGFTTTLSVFSNVAAYTVNIEYHFHFNTLAINNLKGKLRKQSFDPQHCKKDKNPLIIVAKE